MKYIAVAIDGPSGAGKSTISKAIAAKLKFTHIDTGAIYRSIGLWFHKRGIECTDRERIVPLLKDIGIEVRLTENGQRMILDGEDVTDEIRQHYVSSCASSVSAIPEVRSFLLDMQRDFAKKMNVIMDGRDIATVVLPDAAVKIFLTASPESRAKRRYDELRAKGDNVDYDTILSDVIKRDYNDSHRKIAPLKPAEDSIIVDTTELTLEQSIDRIAKIVEEKR